MENSRDQLRLRGWGTASKTEKAPRADHSVGALTYVRIAGAFALLLALYLTSLYSILLFYVLADLVSIVVGLSVFVIAWNSWECLKNSYLLFLGVAFLFVSGLNLLHVLAYKDLGIFRGFDNNLSLQSWIAAGYMLSCSFFIAPLLLKKNLKPGLVFAAFAVVSTFLFLSFFPFRLFPDCYIEGVGPTPFKIVSEIVICLIFLASVAVLVKNRSHFEPRVVSLLIWATALIAASEIAVVLYASVYDLPNQIGHCLRIAAFYLIYKALVETGFKEPYALLLRELRNEHEALRASEAQKQAILDGITAHIAFLNTDRQILWANRAAADWMGKTPSEIIGHHCRELYDSLIQPDEKSPITRALKTGKSLHEEIILSDGGVFTLSSEPVFAPDGSVLGVVLIGEEITERKAAEELVNQTRRLSSIGDLAGGVAHHFNNMLQIVMGNVELALTDFRSGHLSEIDSYLDRALESTKHGAEIVRRLQSFARIRPDEYPVESTVFDLSGMVREAAEIAGPWWQTDSKKEGAKIRLNLDLVEGCMVRGSESELFEVAVSLIRNAAEALPHGGDIRVNTGLDDNQVFLQVEDTGTGIRRDHLSRVFDPFWSGKGPLRAGMGLALSYGIVKRHNGKICVESAEGKGSIFRVQLPLAAECRAESSDTQETALDGKLNILVVDDLKPMADMMEIVLERRGHTVYTALSGPEALEILREHKVDLVVCDLDMPGMNGWDVGRELRTLSEQRGAAKTPFILMTGWHGQTIEAPRITDSGVDGILEKPIEIRRLDDAIRKVTMNKAGTGLHADTA